MEGRLFFPRVYFFVFELMLETQTTEMNARRVCNPLWSFTASVGSRVRCQRSVQWTDFTSAYAGSVAVLTEAVQEQEAGGRPEESEDV